MPPHPAQIPLGAQVPPGTHPRRTREPETVTLPVAVPLVLALLVFAGVFFLLLDPVETLTALTTIRDWPPSAQRALACAAILPLIALAALAARRVTLVRPGGAAAAPPPERRLGDTASLGVFLGSGGHTAEMRAMLAAVDRGRYSPRVYVYCKGDEMSLEAVADIEGAEAAGAAEAVEGKNVGGGVRSPNYSFVCLPRARRVGQGRVSSTFSTVNTFLHALVQLFLVPLANDPLKPWADVLLLNGPGTAVVLVAVMYIRRILGLSYTRIIYVESFARVNSLSLSGKLLRNFVDTFVVQWPTAAGDDLTPINEAAPEQPKGVSQEPTAEELQRAIEERDTRTVYRGWLV